MIQKGITIKKNNKWMVVAITPPNTGTTLPLHPDDVKYASEYEHVEFEVQTISDGSSEFDVMDMDVAKLTKPLNNLIELEKAKTRALICTVLMIVFFALFIALSIAIPEVMFPISVGTVIITLVSLCYTYFLSEFTYNKK